MQLPSKRLFSQFIASYETNVQDGRLCDFARKLTPVAGFLIASKISFKLAVALSLASLKNVSSVSSVVTRRLVGSGFNDNEVASVPCGTFGPVRSSTLLPDLQFSQNSIIYFELKILKIVFFLFINRKSMDIYGRGTSGTINDQMFIELADDYEHISDGIEYIVENCLQTTEVESEEYGSLKEQFNSIYSYSCRCSSDQSDAVCNDGSTCSHGGNYIKVNYNNRFELILNPNRKSQDLIYECSDQCSCPIYCENRLVQYGPSKDLIIVNISHLGKQYGLRTTRKMPAGAFVCEYAGEILTPQEAKYRLKQNDENHLMNYVICLREFPCTDCSTTRLQTFIDPSRKGNIGRYLNHSCDPNCEIISVRIDGPIPKLGIFTKRAVDECEELCFSYGDSSVQSNEKHMMYRKLCHCGSAKCKKYLPNTQVFE